MTGIILVGGRSSRMGANKAFLRIPLSTSGGGGKTIIEMMADKMRVAFKEIIIVTNSTESAEEYQGLDARVERDILPDKNSLGGLYSGLVNANSKYSFVVACDMPFINMRLIEYMKNNCAGFDAIIPRLRTGYETLHSIYSKSCLGPIERQLAQDNLKIRDLFPQIKTNEIGEDTIRRFDPELLSFFNINKADDYQQAVNITPSLCS